MQELCPSQHRDILDLKRQGLSLEEIAARRDFTPGACAAFCTTWRPGWHASGPTLFPPQWPMSTPARPVDSQDLRPTLVIHRRRDRCTAPEATSPASSTP